MFYKTLISNEPNEFYFTVDLWKIILGQIDVDETVALERLDVST